MIEYTTSQQTVNRAARYRRTRRPVRRQGAVMVPGQAERRGTGQERGAVYMDQGRTQVWDNA